MPDISSRYHPSPLILNNADNPANNPSPHLHNACGLLTVRAYGQFMQPNPREEAQFDDALRAINSTATGGALLRAIDTCTVPAHKRPICIFYERDPLDGNEPEFERVELEDVPTINFNVLPADVENDEEKNAYRLMILFAELVSVYASNMGESCPEPTVGCKSFRMAAFREEIGHPAPQWLVDMDNYVLEGPANGEDRHAIREIIASWVDAGEPEEDLDLSYQNLELANFPPLRSVPELTRLNAAGNRIAGFPPMACLPPTLRDISLAGNPVETGADEYGRNLRLVVLSLPPDAIEHFKTLLPPDVEIVRSDGRLVELLQTIEGLRYGVVSPRELMEAGFTDAKTAEILPAELFMAAIKPWLQPHSLDERVWLNAHEDRANLALGMISMLDRLAHMPAAQDTVFRAKFAELLNKMQTPGHEQFFDMCLEIAGSGAESCEDRILETLNELFIAWQCVDGSTGTWDLRVDLMQHARQAFALAAAKQFIARLMPELEARFNRTRPEVPAQQSNSLVDENERPQLDQLEQFLMLRTRIAKINPQLLPPMQFEMQFGSQSILNDNDIVRALDHIEKARNTDWITFLGEWKPLKIIDATAPRLVKREKQLLSRIQSDRGWLYRSLDRLLNTKGDLFVHPDGSGTMLFDVKYPVFWTHYELLIVRELAEARPECSSENIVRSTVEKLARQIAHPYIEKRAENIPAKATAKRVRDIGHAAAAKLILAIVKDDAKETKEIVDMTASRLKRLLPGQEAETLLTCIINAIAAKVNKDVYNATLTEVKRKLVNRAIAQVKTEIVNAKAAKGVSDLANRAAAKLDYDIGKQAARVMNETRSLLRHRTAQQFMRIQGQRSDSGNKLPRLLKPQQSTWTEKLLRRI